MKYLLFPILLLIFIISGCSTEELVSVSDPIPEKMKGNNERILDTLNQTEALECGYKNDYFWEIDHYEPVSGYYIGIWPRNARFQNVDRFNELTAKWGFTYIFCPETLDLTAINFVKSHGFSNETIMAQISPENYINRINLFGNIFSYYIDEPLDRLGDPIYINNIKPYLQSIGNNSSFSISGYRRSYAQDAYVNHADNVLFSAYIHWYSLLGAWVSLPVDPDQRDDWTDMQNRYSGKFSMTWVGAHMDLSEYIDLLGHAANLGLNIVWLYSLEDATDDTDNNNISSFCGAARAAG